MSDHAGDPVAQPRTSPQHQPPQPTVHLHHEPSETIAESAAVAADEALASHPESMAERPSGGAMDEASALQGLTEDVRDQEDLERDITYRAEVALIEAEDDRDQKRIARVEDQKRRLIEQRRKEQARLDKAGDNILLRRRTQTELERIDGEISVLDDDFEQLKKRIADRHQDQATTEDAEVDQSGRLPNESQRDFLIRTGKITPFQRMPGSRRTQVHSDDLSGALLEAEEQLQEEAAEAQAAKIMAAGPKSHVNLRKPGFADESDEQTSAAAEGEFGLRPRKKRRLAGGVRPAASSAQTSDDDFVPEDLASLDDDDEDDDGIIDVEGPRKRKSTGKVKRNIEEQDLRRIDDGNEAVYQSRLKDWVARRGKARRAARERRRAAANAEEVFDDEDSDAEEPEWFKPHPESADEELTSGLRVPGDIAPALYDYQKTGVKWLGELYSQEVGGIVGDEMGLGKTIQAISFIASLHYSKELTKPVIVVAPATVMRQWVTEFHTWWPALRVSILHSSGSGMMNLKHESSSEDEDLPSRRRSDNRPESSKEARRIVNRVVTKGHVLVTTYAGLQTYGDILTSVNWGYAVLDEGHKIRNPNTGITIACKELRTPHRIILSGTPMQNNLVELWSLFDFVFPFRLGSLVNFRQQFEVPIKQGGYANANNLQIMTATKCAETLKDAISPYLLQRLKADVAKDLPKKSERVLFCKLTRPQRDAYETFLGSYDMQKILDGQRQSLYGIDILRKTCNHPDLLDPFLKNRPGYKWGNPNKSGKMQVVKALLEMWKKDGHKTLLFSQGVQMLDIIEEFIKDLPGNFKYLRMDGGTAVKDRQTLVDRFNNDPDIHVFLLTTKVGGLGTNLVGANRVIIFDPDWNPSTDMQARERAWRLGQKREVTIYRLMTAGTIEEKIYHRQIFKQFLTNKVLRDPKQRQNFHLKDLQDLFTLGTTEDGKTETADLFRNAAVDLKKGGGSQGLGAIASRDRASPPSNALAPSDPTDTDDPQDLRALAGVANIEQYKPDEPEPEPGSNDEEKRLMAGIMGLHSALEHDAIINGAEKRKREDGFGILERQAKRVSSEAAVSLRRAAEEAVNTPAGRVTWTGRFGEVGRPQDRRRGQAPSASGLLGGLSARQPATASPAPARGPVAAARGPVAPARGTVAAPRGSVATPPASANAPVAQPMQDYKERIKHFLGAQGGSCPTQSLIDHFRHSIPEANRADKERFVQNIKEVAVMDAQNRGTGRGRWVLKREFGGPSGSAATGATGVVGGSIARGAGSTVVTNAARRRNAAIARNAARVAGANGTVAVHGAGEPVRTRASQRANRAQGAQRAQRDQRDQRDQRAQR